VSGWGSLEESNFMFFPISTHASFHKHSQTHGLSKHLSQLLISQSGSRATKQSHTSSTLDLPGDTFWSHDDLK
jgi:hypothetical protein